MIGIAGLVVCAALGADYGWEPAADGNSLEYIIQINPDLLPSLQDGDEIRRAIPPEAANVTCFRIKIGNGELPRHTVRNNPHVPMRATQAGAYDDHNPAQNRPVLGRQNQQPHYPNGPIGVDYNGPIGPPSPYGGSTFGQNQPNQSSFGAQPQPQYNYDSGSLMNDPAHDPLFNRYTNNNNNQSSFLTVPPNPNNLLASAPRTTNPATQYRGVSPTGATVNNGNNGFGNTTRYMSDADKPWWPLLATTIALFISLGGNAYLGWVAAEFYTRYRDTVERMRAERRY